MKKIIAIILCICLVFSFSITSFAVTADEQSTDLKSGWGSGTSVNYPTGYSTSWFYKVVYLLREIMVDINDIRNDTYDMRPNIVSIASKSELTYNLLNGELKNYISTSTGHLYLIKEEILTFDSYLSDILSDTASIQSDVSMLQKVLADEDDLAFKQSQKENQEYIQDTYFGSDGDLSLNVADLGILTKYVREFKTSFNYEETYGSPTPVSVISEYSDFFEWFSDSTGLAMDPSFQGSSGGIVTPPDLPEYSTVNILPYALTSTTSESIFAGTGYRNNRKFSGLTLNTDGGLTYFIEPDEFSSDFSVTGYFYCEPGDVFYFYNIDAGDIFVPNVYFGTSSTDILSGSFWEIYKPDSFAFPSLEPDENNVYSYTIPSLPAGTNPPNDIIACRFMFSGSLNSGSFISLNHYPFENAPVPDEPEPEPLVNWLPLASTEPGGSEIYNDIGYMPGYRFSQSTGTVTSNNATTLAVSGYIPCSPGDIIYFTDFYAPSVNDGYYFIFYFYNSSSTSSIRVDLSSYVVSDSLNNFSIVVPDDFQFDYFRFNFGKEYIPSVYINQNPNNYTSVSSFSLRSFAPIDDSQAVVTSYYEQRQLELKRIRGGK